MFDFGAVELLIVAVVAIIVVGPKDLPRMLKVAGQWVGKLKSMAREFQAQFDAAADQVGLDEIRDDFKKITEFDLDADLSDPIGEVKNFGESIKETIESPIKSTVKRATSGSKKKKSETKPTAKKPAGTKSTVKRRKRPAAAPASPK